MHRSTPLALLLLAPAALAQNEGFDPPKAFDLDPDPDVIEIELRAQVSDWEYTPGVLTEVYNYNGSIPGPTIEGKVGDTVRVHFTNDLPEPTTIHWHGLEIQATMDGSNISQLHVQPGETFEYEFPLLRDGLYWYHPHVRTFDQVERGLYGVIVVRDPELERRLELDQIEEHIIVFDDILLDADMQVVPAFNLTDPLDSVIYQLNGREGNHLLLNGRIAADQTLVVENGKLHRWRVLNASNTTFCRLDANADAQVVTWMIGTDSGIITERRSRPPVQALIPPSPNLTIADRLFKYESFFAQPETPTEEGVSGNAATDTTLAAFGKKLVEVEEEVLDGLEEWERELSEFHSVPQIDREGILLVPGERMDVVFFPIAEDGDRLRVSQFDWFRGRHTADYAADGTIVLPDEPNDGRMPSRTYFHLEVEGDDPGAPYPRVPRHLRQLEMLDPDDAVGVLPVTFGHSLPDENGDVKLFAQANFVDDGMGGVMMVPLPTPLVDSFEAFDVKMGETWIWEITNLTHGDHPFHAHGFFFQPFEIETIDQEAEENNRKKKIDFPLIKDTFRVPARPNLRGTSKTIVRALVKFDDTGREGQAFAQGQLPTFDAEGDWTSGGWLFHCHVLEHSGNGMLSFYEVHDPDDPFWLLGKHTPGTLGNPSLTARGDLTPGHPGRGGPRERAPGHVRHAGRRAPRGQRERRRRHAGPEQRRHLRGRHRRRRQGDLEPGGMGRLPQRDGVLRPGLLPRSRRRVGHRLLQRAQVRAPLNAKGSRP